MGCANGLIQSRSDRLSFSAHMAKIIGVFASFHEAQAAAESLGARLVPRESLSIIGYDAQGKKKIGILNAKTGKRKSNLKKSVMWGGALGLATTFLLPGGGHLFVAGHVVRTALQVKAAGAFVGAVAVSTADLLRQAGLTRRAAQEVASIVAEGRFALALKSDWITTQRARLALGEAQWQPAARLLECVLQYAYEHQAFVSLYGGMEVWFSAAPEAAVVYRRLGKVAVVSAAPLTATENLTTVTHQFLAFCQAQKMDCLMVPVGPEFARVAEECGMGLLSIGESGYFQLPDWKPRGDKGKKVRAGVNQARRSKIERRKGRRSLHSALRRWLGSRRASDSSRFHAS